MKALAWNVEQQKLDLIDMEEPQIQAADEVKLRVLKVGICGTDREEVHSKWIVTPEGKNAIIVGHEMLGRVVDVGPLVTHTKPGDLAIFTVRRGCSECPACDKGANDMCYTGKYLERGIRGEDGFQAEFVVDREKYLIKVPESLASCAVLCEPMSVVQKAVEHATHIQQNRLPDWKEAENCWERRRVLVAGVGAIGLLAAIAFCLRGAQVWGYDIVDPSSLRPQILKKLGGTYIYAKETKPSQITSVTDHLDIIFEAAGNTQLCFDLIAALGANGCYVVTGIPEKNKEVKLDGGNIMHQMVMKNQIIIGSVNAGQHHWEKAIEDLSEAKKKWGALIDSFITREFVATEFEKPFFSREQNEIKSIIGWGNA